MRRSLVIKVCCLCILVVGFSLFLGQIIHTKLILPDYIKLEKEFAQKDIIRCAEAIDNEVYHLNILAGDWAFWDEMYGFVEEQHSAFYAANLEMETLTETGIDLIFILSDKKNIIIDQIYDKENETEISLPSFSAKTVLEIDLFTDLLDDKEKSISGIHLTPKGIMFISAFPILPSNGSGKPNGILVMGRFFTDAILKSLNDQTQLSFTVTAPDFTRFQKTDLSKMQSKQGFLSENSSTAYLIAQKIKTDIFNNPALLIEAQIPRDIYYQGIQTSKFAALIVTTSVGFILLSTVGLALIYRLKKETQQQKDKLLIAQKNDEISVISAQLNALSEAATEALMLVEDGYCVAMNSHTQKIFGYTMDEVHKQPTSNLVIPEERPRVHELITSNYEGFYETVGLRKDNSTFPLLVHGKALIFDNQNIRAVAIKDLTEQKQSEAERQILEDKLQRSERMESIGLLAGSVAHDLNNILSGVVTYPELLLLKLDPNDPLRKPIEEIQKSGKKAAEVVEDLLTVARGIALIMMPVNINNLIKTYLNSPELETLLKQYTNITIQPELDDEIPNVIGSPIHINKTVMNLLTNAIEAIGDSTAGIVTVTTQVETRQENTVDLKAGTYVSVEIRDNGTGISRGDLEHIFEPFYSRKIKGRSGTGLGLAIVWNAMQDHKGTVNVVSDKTGTCFTLYFPATDDNLLTAEESIDINAIKGQQQTILVIDDNEQQLEIAKQILITLNYTVYTANSGEEALNYLKDHKVDLVVLDMIMEPGLSGLETYNFAIKLQPQLKALIASGFSVSEEVEQLQHLGASAFIRKPYSISQIGHAVKKILQG